VGVDLPEFSRAEFDRRLTAAVRPQTLPPAAGGLLHAHYEELRRWNRTVALVGPAFASEGIAEHYAESLAGLEFLTADDRTLLDVGSGAGFPGLVLAAARPDLEVVLVEARERKCAFLAAAARRMSLQVRCLNARLDTPPPQGLPKPIDVVTVRAVRIDSRLLAPVLPLLTEHGRILLWATERGDAPTGLELLAERGLTGTRRILAYGRRR
jgi:16S rRNA (guanine(527)-N(7))-methyltransferase RsmG